MTGLPMVFGLWTVNKNSQIYKDKALFEFINKRFSELRDKGFGDYYADMIIEAFKETGLNRTTLKSYFKNLNYNLDEKHKESLKAFYEKSNQIVLTESQ